MQGQGKSGSKKVQQSEAALAEPAAASSDRTSSTKVPPKPNVPHYSTTMNRNTPVFPWLHIVAQLAVVYCTRDPKICDGRLESWTARGGQENRRKGLQACSSQTHANKRRKENAPRPSLKKGMFCEGCQNCGLRAVGKILRSQAPKCLEINAVQLLHSTATRNPPRSREPHLGERSQKEGILSYVALETGTTGPSVRQAERPWVMQAPHGFQLAISPQGSWSERRCRGHNI